MTLPHPPSAVYRLQFNRHFTFADATAILDYLHRLGISHVYASPYLKARNGSPHGYDIVDHNALNPEIGDRADYDAFVARLHELGMGQVLDIVPNHMGIGGCDNAWWLDVLEHGEASEYAGFFDIDWHPGKTELHNRVLLPLLGDHYGRVLEDGELRLELDAGRDGFTIHYYEHCLPVDPRTWPMILEHDRDRLEQALADQESGRRDYHELIADCRGLPRRTEPAAEARQLRREGGARCRRRLAALCREHSAVIEPLSRTIAELNGTPDRPDSFDGLHQLIEAQAYRPAYWQVASDEINYRRFFDINNLAGLRMQDPATFQATHSFLHELVRSGHLDGLRIDHLDGMADPAGYCRQLHDLCAGARPDRPPLLLAEKILAGHEGLPADWPIAGTTGYEMAWLLNGLLVRPDAERALTQLYVRFTGRREDFDEVLYQCKQRVIRTTLSSELTYLAHRLDRIAESDRHTRDFTLHSLRAALAEIVACFPVYRTYGTGEALSEQELRHIHWALAKARQRSRASDLQVFDFVQRILEYEAGRCSSNLEREILRFLQRFQQYTAPVMAKGMEDTAFYAYHRLTSLNDVGFDPRVFGITPAAFHQENLKRRDKHPAALTATSTHDSKRGEDVRARIDVLSELTEEWRRHLGRWSRMNRRRKKQVDGQPAPDRNDEYLLYQTLVGVWPLQMPDGKDLDTLQERIAAYLVKAAREAKQHTSWINPDPEYEDALQAFLASLLQRPDRNSFLADFLPLQQRIARLGLFNSLSQTLLKTMVPGCPDLYQGNELWAFQLVDPDNRRAVDYVRRRALLETFEHHDDSPQACAELAAELLKQLEDGRLKLYVTWRALTLRRQTHPLCAEGDYLPLTVSGTRAEHVVAFARRFGERSLVVAAGRWFAGLVREERPAPVGDAVWGGTYIELPGDMPTRYHDRLSGQAFGVKSAGEGPVLDLGEVFTHLPLALLISE